MVGVEFEAFVAARGAALVRFAYLLTHDSAAAEDLVQEALMRSHRRWRSIDEPEAYVRRSIVTAHLSWRRRRASTELVGAVPERVSPGEAERVVQQDLVWSLLTRLPRRQQVVLALRYWEGLPDGEIARVLDCAEGTVRSLAARAFATLRTDPALAER